MAPSGTGSAIRKPSLGTLSSRKIMSSSSRSCSSRELSPFPFCFSFSFASVLLTAPFSSFLPPGMITSRARRFAASPRCFNPAPKTLTTSAPPPPTTRQRKNSPSPTSTGTSGSFITGGGTTLNPGRVRVRFCLAAVPSFLTDLRLSSFLPPSLSQPRFWFPLHSPLNRTRHPPRLPTRDRNLQNLRCAHPSGRAVLERREVDGAVVLGG